MQNGLGGDCSRAILLQNEDGCAPWAYHVYKSPLYPGHGAEAAEGERFAFNDLPNIDDAVAHIVALKGFGQWSAEIYLLFSEGRGDMFPAGDLAVQRGYQRLRGLSETPKEKQLRSMTESWAPYRGAMAIFLWHLYMAQPFIMGHGAQLEHAQNEQLSHAFVAKVMADALDPVSGCEHWQTRHSFQTSCEPFVTMALTK